MFKAEKRVPITKCIFLHIEDNARFVYANFYWLSSPILTSVASCCWAWFWRQIAIATTKIVTLGSRWWRGDCVGNDYHADDNSNKLFRKKTVYELLFWFLSVVVSVVFVVVLAVVVVIVVDVLYLFCILVGNLLLNLYKYAGSEDYLEFKIEIYPKIAI